jgi:hypothetical protein
MVWFLAGGEKIGKILNTSCGYLEIRRLGPGVLNLTQSAISHAVRRGRKLVESNSYSIADN